VKYWEIIADKLSVDGCRGAIARPLSATGIVLPWRTRSDDCCDTALYKTIRREWPLNEFGEADTADEKRTWKSFNITHLFSL
jgi:hypothetical protein